MQDRPFDSPYPSGKLMKAEDVTPQLKGRQAEVRQMLVAPSCSACMVAMVLPFPGVLEAA